MIEILTTRNIPYEGAFPALTVKAETPTGFDVWIEAWDNEYIVFFGNAGWHEHFSNVHDAANCFIFGLTSACSLQIIERGGAQVKCTLQYLEDDQWVDDSEVGKFFTPFWRKKTIRYLQNNYGNLRH